MLYGWLWCLNIVFICRLCKAVLPYCLMLYGGDFILKPKYLPSLGFCEKPSLCFHISIEILNNIEGLKFNHCLCIQPFVNERMCVPLEPLTWLACTPNKRKQSKSSCSRRRAPRIQRQELLNESFKNSTPSNDIAIFKGKRRYILA